MGYFEGNPLSIPTEGKTPQIYNKGPIFNGKRLGILLRPVPTGKVSDVKPLLTAFTGPPHLTQPVFMKIPKPTKEQKIGFGIIQAQQITKAREERYNNKGADTPVSNARIQGPLDRAFVRNEINALRQHIGEEVKAIRSRGRGRPPYVIPHIPKSTKEKRIRCSTASTSKANGLRKG